VIAVAWLVVVAIAFLVGIVVGVLLAIIGIETMRRIDEEP
jgi:hypothetical protein